jgi:hypothetical protein
VSLLRVTGVTICGWRGKAAGAKVVAALTEAQAMIHGPTSQLMSVAQCFVADLLIYT